MSSVSAGLVNCPSCGAPNPTNAEVCTHCSGRIAALRTELPSRLDIVLQTLGIFLFAVGFVLLLTAIYFHQSIESPIFVAGAVGLVAGILLVASGAYLRSE